MALEVTKSFNEDNSSWIIKPIGEVDIYTSPLLRKVLNDAINEKMADIIINGENLDYIDSTGLGVLIGILKEVKKNRKNVIIKSIKPNIRNLFDITGLSDVFIIEE